MNQAQAFFSHPGVSFLALLVIGAIAGWVAERVTESRHGILTNILVGIAGAFIGGKLAEVFDIAVFGFWRTLVSAIVGAILLLFVWRALRGRM
ncbi:MAG: GlsB/YeaQ/YmgE family stress response membrane protein [Xanthobacteraceae bacterium]|nr:MAG: GlsB/YeaQ/YmgE family stress response membrane protein [Xanthobacteraceae bacterium]